MPDATELLSTIKKAAIEAIESTKPTKVFFGTVTSANPLKINVEQKMELTAKQLVLCRTVTEHKVKITGGNIKNYYYTGDIDSATAPVVPSHVHAIGQIEITVHNGLVVGDDVILLQQQEGQKFIVVDRVAK